MSRLVLFLTCLSIAATACDANEVDPRVPLQDQQWDKTVDVVDGIPIGELQVERAMEADAGRDAAIHELTVRKRIVKKALEEPPTFADIHRRQAMVETMLLEEPEQGESARAEVDEATIESVRAGLRANMRQPAGHVATLVQIRGKEGVQLSREVLLERAKSIRGELGETPTDDEVAALTEREFPDVDVVVEYGVQFAALGESKRRPGWVQVSEIGAGEIQSMSDGERVTTVYTINETVAEFMVKIMEIPAVRADEDEIEKMIDEQINEGSRKGFASKLVDKLIDDKSWSMFPETMEDELEGE